MKVFQDPLNAFLKANPNLQGQSLRVFWYLTSVAEWENRIPTPAQVADKIELHRTAVSRAYGQLIDAGALIKIDHEYRLNPLICWKGTDQALQALLESQYMTIFRPPVALAKV